MDDPDGIIISRVAEGEIDAFEQLVAKYEQSVFGSIYRYIGDRDEAEDIAQDVFLKVWRYARTFSGNSKFSTWLYRIVVNQCLTYRAKRKKRPQSLYSTIEETESSSGALDAVEEKKRAEIVRRAIDQLPGRQRIALILSRFESRSYKEIAEIMGVSISTVESLVFRAKRGLRSKLLPLKEKGEI
jgi:RNA polymerase sigma-70 factor (ECF subfamily)